MDDTNTIITHDEFLDKIVPINGEGGGEWTVRLADMKDCKEITRLYADHIPDWWEDGSFVNFVARNFPGSILIGVDSKGDICGTSIVLPVGSDSVSIGYLFVRSDMRGNGLGTGLFDRSLTIAGHKNKELAAVEASVSFYQSRGFIESDKKQVCLDIIKRDSEWTHNGSSIKIVPATSSLLGEIVVYDTTIYPTGREGYIRDILMESPATVKKVAIDNDEIVGVCFVRTLKIGADKEAYEPVLYAENDDVAGRLLSAVMREVPDGGLVSLTIFVNHTGAFELCKEIGEMVGEYPLTWMHTSRSLPAQQDRIYFITGQAFYSA